MSPGDQSSLMSLLSGERRGIGASLARGALRAGEAIYSSLVQARNDMYDRGALAIQRLPVPVVSVGNITAGGTGKTPVVRWLAWEFRLRGLKPAILMRGYRRGKAAISDEQDLLAEALGDVPVHADPDRCAGGRAVLAEHPDTSLFILDDGFQHRRLARDVDIVLLDATNPLGFGHVHPRGLLREPLAGLRRADAFILTRSDLAAPTDIAKLNELLRPINHRAPLYRARHVLIGLRAAGQSLTADADTPLGWLESRRFYAVAAIANPAALDRQLCSLRGTYAGHWWLPDHHDYSAADLGEIQRRAAQSNADVVLVTEKDWRKLRRLPGAAEAAPPICRLDLAITFDADGAAGLIKFIQARLDKSEI